ncbi:HK97 gp10 family phage protein [Microbacterium sp. NPDC078428]|uniref:HK97 gp10 family phage protein n=1 Tax=Microbacterium sp. NPDC078428 TaxID=3364190 RepID=UPI0037CAF482
MAVKFNNAFFDDLSRSAGVAALVDEATERIAQTARSTAPTESGDYRDGIVTAGKYQRRYVGLVIGTDPKTMIIESRTGNLARALRANVKRGRRG